jgi:hypothetical protein
MYILGGIHSSNRAGLIALAALFFGQAGVLAVATDPAIAAGPALERPAPIADPGMDFVDRVVREAEPQMQQARRDLEGIERAASSREPEVRAQFQSELGTHNRLREEEYGRRIEALGRTTVADPEAGTYRVTLDRIATYCASNTCDREVFDLSRYQRFQAGQETYSLSQEQAARFANTVFANCPDCLQANHRLATEDPLGRRLAPYLPGANALTASPVRVEDTFIRQSFVAPMTVAERDAAGLSMTEPAVRVPAGFIVRDQTRIGMVDEDAVTIRIRPPSATTASDVTGAVVEARRSLTTLESQHQALRTSIDFAEYTAAPGAARSASESRGLIYDACESFTTICGRVLARDPDRFAAPVATYYREHYDRTENLIAHSETMRTVATVGQGASLGLMAASAGTTAVLPAGGAVVSRVLAGGARVTQIGAIGASGFHTQAQWERYQQSTSDFTSAAGQVAAFGSNRDATAVTLYRGRSVDYNFNSAAASAVQTFIPKATGLAGGGSTANDSSLGRYNSVNPEARRRNGNAR